MHMAGKFRLPGIGGLVSPGQGLFPKLTSGIHEKDGSQLVVSRGIGNSLLPVRIFNQAGNSCGDIKKKEG